MIMGRSGCVTQFHCYKWDGSGKDIWIASSTPLLKFTGPRDDVPHPALTLWPKEESVEEDLNLIHQPSVDSVPEWVLFRVPPKRHAVRRA